MYEYVSSVIQLYVSVNPRVYFRSGAAPCALAQRTERGVSHNPPRSCSPSGAALSRGLVAHPWDWFPLSLGVPGAGCQWGTHLRRQ